jgi:hypothetical protein
MVALRGGGINLEGDQTGGSGVRGFAGSGNQTQQWQSKRLVTSDYPDSNPRTREPANRELAIYVTAL